MTWYLFYSFSRSDRGSWIGFNLIGIWQPLLSTFLNTRILLLVVVISFFFEFLRHYYYDYYCCFSSPSIQFYTNFIYRDIDLKIYPNTKEMEIINSPLPPLSSNGDKPNRSQESSPKTMRRRESVQVLNNGPSRFRAQFRFILRNVQVVFTRSAFGLRISRG